VLVALIINIQAASTSNNIKSRPNSVSALLVQLLDIALDLLVRYSFNKKGRVLIICFVYC
jgi:hypothetical protein